MRCCLATTCIAAATVPARAALVIRCRTMAAAATAAPAPAPATLPGFPAAIRWDLDAAAIASAADGVIARSTAVLDAVAAACATPTLESVIAPLARLDLEVEPLTAVTFLRHASTDAALRDAASAAHVKLEAFNVAAGMREDVYRAVKAFAAAHPDYTTTLDRETARFVERTLRDYRRRGLELDPAKRARVQELRTKATELCERFTREVAESTSARKLYFPPTALRGMPDGFIASLKRVGDTEATGESCANRQQVEAVIAARTGGAEAGGVDATPWCEVTLAYPHVVPLLKLAAVPSTRAAVERAFNSRAAPTNVAVLEELVTIRRQVAGLLGYPTPADHVLEERMAKNSDTVRASAAAAVA